MTKVLQINTEATGLSTGRITEGIGNAVLSHGWESFITYGRLTGESNSHMFAIGNKKDFYIHALDSRLLGRTGYSSKNATLQLLEYIKHVQPDIIQLHNLHGYYLNLELLFNYLNNINTPLVWAFHDLWPVTGHCTQFENVGCDKWKTTCHQCPQLNEYPKSILFDRSQKSHQLKKKLFTNRTQLQIITSSKWSKNHIEESYFSKYPIEVIPNGVNTTVFTPKDTINKRKALNLDGKQILLGVAGVWNNKKGLHDFIKLNELISDDQVIILIGLSSKQISQLPKKIIGVERTTNIEELAIFYSMADIFLNLTYADTFPTTNLEALACGTPIITYDTGGSVESVFNDAGKIVAKGNIPELVKAIEELSSKSAKFYQLKCSQLAKEYYDMTKQFNKYHTLYEKLLS
jgi:putative colanic acid biosynthesis glycosyltransferase